MNVDADVSFVNKANFTFQSDRNLQKSAQAKETTDLDYKEIHQ